ncbi:transmembrane protein, putative (macronuclear) [Tetrahymena thermophila SB210]|uniref:Transmembrane protein, putative n=1 Tax=Tetrahymena thermophila (strain SB210) TaxID=312017 RepID=W7X5F5_TETTS|nr:transmembrane protein, putative [Tetrahymena thermophila SB210]EWS72622.1 transmembrane protein, putative [Tetrahymena thermophila SB210]|eukprot:XP_012654905.1 transmembrane protein, putative [Tetrahymena thermophila SB210]
MLQQANKQTNKHMNFSLFCFLYKQIKMKETLFEFSNEKKHKNFFKQIEKQFLFVVNKYRIFTQYIFEYIFIYLQINCLLQQKPSFKSPSSNTLNYIHFLQIFICTIIFILTFLLIIFNDFSSKNELSPQQIKNNNQVFKIFLRQIEKQFQS